MYRDNYLKKQLKDKYGDEQVFVVPFGLVKNIPDRFTKETKGPKELEKMLNSICSRGQFIFRYDAEYNPAFQQLIPYVVISNLSGTRYYVSERISGDARLVSKYSLGFGGHINPIDNGHENLIMAALKRELCEELFYEKMSEPEFLGYIRDLHSETRDHLGFVFQVKAKKVRIKETDVLKGKWMTLEELEDRYFHFESWSRYIIDYLLYG